MIAHVSGEIVEKTHSSLIIDVAGIGYEIQVAATDFEAVNIGDNAKFYTHDHLRENAHELFGFSQLAAKRLFEMLISVSGVGPKMALAILSLGDIEATRNAIASGDSTFVQRASGVGKRLAERITVDLRDKVGAAVSFAGSVSLPVGQDDALDALLALGYSIQQASEKLKNVDSTLNTQERIKLALQTAD
jgi:Holliday junction DNA helicase RuvA